MAVGGAKEGHSAAAGVRRERLVAKVGGRRRNAGVAWPVQSRRTEYEENKVGMGSIKYLCMWVPQNFVKCVKSKIVGSTIYTIVYS
jgi:hypothetical protein